VGSILFSQQEANGGTAAPVTSTDGGTTFSVEWQALPPALQGYCAYTWESPMGAPEDPSAFQTSQAATIKTPITFGPDCELVSPVESFSAMQCDQLPGSNPVGQICQPLWQALLTRTEANPQPPASPAPDPKNVQVEIIDTTRTGDSADPNPTIPSPHGNTLGAVVAGVACSAPPCPGLLHWQLALPHKSAVDGRGDFDAGGQFGTPAEVAVAAWASVGPPNGGNTAVASRIVNLSVGWSHEDMAGSATCQAGDAGVAFCPAETAARDALEFAACHGALVLAAAGNKSGPDSSDAGGPLYPAAWEGPPRANTTCSDYGTTQTIPTIVYAVGGVDVNDGVLANARPGGRPSLAAYANGVTAPYKAMGLPGYTPIMTGSSIATGVVSGVAAVVWGSSLSGAGPGFVHDAVYDAGVDLGVHADFPSGSGNVRRISLCRALGGAASTCVAEQMPLLAVTPFPVVDAGLPAVPCSGSTCPTFNPTANSIDTPWVYPQPGGSECGGCILYRRLVIPFVAGDDDGLGPLVFEGIFLTPFSQPATVTTTGLDGSTASYAILPPDSGAFQFFSTVLDDEAGTPASAIFSVLLDGDGGSTFDPVLVIQ
jgi:hypothetical protein